MQDFRNTGLAMLLAASLLASAAPAHAAADSTAPAAEAEAFDPSATTLPAPEAENPALLQLEVSLNGQPANLIVTVHQLPDGRFAMPRSEYATLRIAVPEGPADELLALDGVEMLAYVYDESRQRLEISVPPERLLRTSLNAQARPDAEKPLDPALPGLVVNYSAYGSTSYQFAHKLGSFDGASLALDARAGSRFGVLRQTGFVTSRDFRSARFTRLDTSWSYDDPKRQMTWRAGDLYSGSLPWTRSLRMGGLQLQRDFSLRPGLVTMPLPAFSGTAALPSTVEVFVNNTKTYSTEVPPGPFSISDIPVLSGGGKARFVLYDAAGQQRVSESDFFTSPDLLSKGLLDFSAEAGFARLGTGIESFDYGAAPVASLTARYGATDRITMLGHLEGGAGLANGSLGARAHLGDWGMFTLGAGASVSKDGGSGFLGHASYDKEWGPLSFGLSTTRIFRSYRDLADVTLRPLTVEEQILGYASGSTPKAADQVFLGTHLPWEGSFLSIALANLEAADGNASTIGSLSFGRSFGRGISLSANSFVDFRTSSFGLLAGLTMELGPASAASASLAASHGDANASLDYFRSGQHKGNDWRIAAGHSQGASSRSRASLDYRAPKADLRASVSQADGEQFFVNAAADGAITLASGNVFASRQITDSYAVVDVGAPGVQVLSENRPVGITGRSGKILLPNLRGYEMNTITLDPSGLPLDADVPVTSASVRPARGTGALVRFGAREKTNAALVVLQDGQGKPVELGAAVSREGGVEQFTVGYDGETYIQGLEAENAITVITSTGQCTARFSYSTTSAQPVIGPVPCT